jgi:uncharacterized protein (TIGR00251 family)
MTPRAHSFKDAQTGAAITVRATPRAGHNAVTGFLPDGTVKIRLAAAPVDGEANAELVKYLAGLLDISASQIEIVAGATGRNKLISITGLSAAEVNARLLALAK